MKVCLLNGHLILRKHKTGVHILHTRITKGLVEKENNLDISIVCLGNKNECEKIIKDDKYKWMHAYTKFCGFSSRLLSYIVPIEIFTGRQDVYFCDGNFPLLFFRKSKRICFVHDLMVKIYPENYSYIKRLYLEIYFRKLKKADRILCNSESTKKDVKKYYGIDESKIYVCGCSCDDMVTNTDVLSRFSQEIKNRYLLYIGDMRKNKNILNMIKGFIRFLKINKCDDYYLYLAGKKTGDYEAAKALVDNSGYNENIKFLGYISNEDKVVLYKNTEAVMLVSFYEGFGIPIIEALNFEKPVITSNCSSMREIGEGVSILVDPDNIDEISDAILKIYKKEYFIDKKKIRERLNLYSYERVVENVEQSIVSIYED